VEAPLARTGTILLVDDEDAVRTALRRLLTAQGHSVLEASDGLEAMDVVRMRAGNLDLVLSDVVMPGMNGTELAATLGRQYPGLPVILMSAYAPAGLSRVGTNGLVVPVLQKPFERDELAELIQIALELPGLPPQERPSTAST
jgi:two-component system cell cycle sensor histidine kinase/response regulator CckA